MKVYISVDMEGVAGTLSWKQESTNRAYMDSLLVSQMEWVVQGIRSSSVNHAIDQIVVADAHGRGDSIPYTFTELDDRLYLISGAPRPNYMMPGLDKNFDVVFLIGYHSGAGTINGVMDHTYTNSFQRLLINGQTVNEALMNSALAGYYGVPVGLVIGDEALARQLQGADGLPWVQFVTTKSGLSRYSAMSRPAAVVKKETIDAVVRVLDSDLKALPLYRFTSPVKMTIEFQNTLMADIVNMLPGIIRLDGRTIEMNHEDFAVIYNARSPIGILAGSFQE